MRSWSRRVRRREAVLAVMGVMTPLTTERDREDTVSMELALGQE